MGNGCRPLNAQQIDLSLSQLMITAEQRYRSEEEAASGDGHQGNRVAVGATGGWRSSGGVIAALRAALGKGWSCA